MTSFDLIWLLIQKLLEEKSNNDPDENNQSSQEGWTKFSFRSGIASHSFYNIGKIEDKVKGARFCSIYKRGMCSHHIPNTIDKF